ncbi:MAG: glycosyltransferase family 4 protein [Phycisphaerae bacterium]
MYAPFAIDARWYGTSGSGVSTYAHSLLAGLMELDYPANIHVIVNRPECLPEAVARYAKFNFIECPGNPTSVRHQRLLPSIISRHNIRCLHTVDVHAPLFARCRQIITCHDVIPLILSLQEAGGAKARYRRLWRNWLKLQCRRADRIVTISECSRRDIKNVLHVEPGKIHVVPPALYQADSRRSATEFAQHSQFQSDNRQLILSVGRRAPYKNLFGLIQAFARLVKTGNSSCRLLIIGPTDPRYGEPESLVAKLGLSDSVTFTGYISDSDLAELYSRASLFVCPSLYEGFGLPVLEAMAAGVPVVSSNRSSLPEACGDAALLVDPTDSEAMAEAMGRVLCDARLADQLRAAGRQHVAQFSPGRMAEQLLKIYSELCEGN